MIQLMTSLTLLLAAQSPFFESANGLQITREGAGGLNGKVAYNRSAIAAALPGLSVDRGSERGQTVYIVRDGEGALLRVYGGAQVETVRGVSAKVHGPGGERIGARHGDFEAEEVRVCEPGAGRDEGKLLCANDKDSHVWFVFSTKDGAKRDAPLTEIRWIAGGPPVVG